MDDGIYHSVEVFFVNSGTFVELFIDLIEYSWTDFGSDPIMFFGPGFKNWSEIGTDSIGLVHSLISFIF